MQKNQSQNANRTILLSVWRNWPIAHAATPSTPVIRRDPSTGNLWRWESYGKRVSASRVFKS
jgi:hypothetical protein